MKRMIFLGSAKPSKTPEWTPPSVAELQGAFADYEVSELIGQGGMGAVYKAVQKSLQRVVAIKILPRELSEQDPQFASRFEREATAMAALNHKNIVAVHDFGVSECGLAYYVMEFVDGTDLAQSVKDRGRLSPAETVGIMAEVCDAIQYAHERGIIHRDIKPSNILIDSTGNAKVADFGLARDLNPSDTDATAVTLTDIVMGTLAYMSPEQAHGRSTDRRSDIYSIGALVYELLTGERPLGAIQPPSNSTETTKKMDDVVVKALAQNPELRFQNAAALKQALQRALSDGDANRSSAFSRTHRIGAVLLMAGIAGWMLRNDAHDSKPVREARSTSAQPSSVSTDFAASCARAAHDRGALVTVSDSNGNVTRIQPEAPLPKDIDRLLAIRFDRSTSQKPVLSSSDIIQMIQAPDIEELSFFQTFPELDDAVFDAIGALPHLRVLNFNSPTIHDDWLRHLSGHTSLTEFRIPQSHISDAGIRHLNEVPTLRIVDWNDSAITGAAIAELACAPELTWLKFGDRTRIITADDLASIANRCFNLDRLEITGQIQPRALTQLARLPKLNSLAFGDQTVFGFHLEELHACTSLEELSFVRCIVEESVWESLSALTQLTRLRLGPNAWCAAAAKSLARMPSLQSLTFMNTDRSELPEAQTALPNVVVKAIP